MAKLKFSSLRRVSAADRYTVHFTDATGMPYPEYAVIEYLKRPLLAKLILVKIDINHLIIALHLRPKERRFTAHLNKIKTAAILTFFSYLRHFFFVGFMQFF